MPVLVQAIETAFTIDGFKDGEVVIQALDEDGKPGQKYQLPVGDTFHFAYDVSIPLRELLIAWFTGQPVRTPARAHCRCLWDRKTD